MFWRILKLIYLIFFKLFKMINKFPNIISNPEILGGKPCIKGTRISVELIIEWLATGGNIQTIVAKHPLLTEEAVKEAIFYANN